MENGNQPMEMDPFADGNEMSLAGWKPENENLQMNPDSLGK